MITPSPQHSYVPQTPNIPTPTQAYPQPATYDTTGQVAPPGMKPRVTATLWEDEGSLCFQVEAKGVCVARREGTIFSPKPTTRWSPVAIGSPLQTTILSMAPSYSMSQV